MNRRLILGAVSFLITLTFIFAQPEIVHSEEMLVRHGMRGGCMHGGGMSQCDGRIIHQLFSHHDQIKRTVEEIPGGIRAVTESDDPEVATLIQDHVSRMYERVENQQRIPMMRMSSTLPEMTRNSDLYDRQLEITPQGIIVTETSDDPELVTIIREHADEVTGFVQQGRSGMMNHRMR